MRQNGAVSAPWQPFGLSEEESVDYEVLIGGVPAWLRTPLLTWVRQRFATRQPDWLNAELLLDCQASLRFDTGATVAPNGFIHQRQTWPLLAALDDDQLLRLVDYLLSRISSPSAIDRLDSMLAEAKSKWRIGTRMGKRGLVERVPEGVQQAVEATIARAGDSGRVLARAWAHVHGLNPEDSTAFAEAVKAVEIAAVARVQPNNASASLGTVLGQMKADGDWRLPLREHTDAPGPQLILSMIRTLWYGHRDRHGGVNYSDVRHDEARAAVVLAASLIDWFESEALQRRSP